MDETEKKAKNKTTIVVDGKEYPAVDVNVVGMETWEYTKGRYPGQHKIAAADEEEGEKSPKDE